MLRYLKKHLSFIKRRVAFTLIELLIVIGLVSIISVVLILFLDSAKITSRARDSRRAYDVKTIQNSMNRYINDAPLFGISSFRDFHGYSNLFAGAVDGTKGNCPNGINGFNLKMF